MLKLLSFDVDLIRVQCEGLTDPLAEYVWKMSMSILSAALLCAFHVLVNSFRPGLSSMQADECQKGGPLRNSLQGPGF